MQKDPPVLRPEPTTAKGEVLLTPNQISILHGLYDRPDGASASTIDLAWAARPYIRPFRTDDAFAYLGTVARGMHASWLSSEKIGTRRVWRLEERGREILTLRVPVYIKSYGRYRGMANLRMVTGAKRAERDRRIGSHVEIPDDSVEPWLEAIVELVSRWKEVKGSDDAGDVFILRVQGSALDAYLRCYVLENGALPWGTHEIPAGHTRFHVNFEELR